MKIIPAETHRVHKDIFISYLVARTGAKLQHYTLYIETDTPYRRAITYKQNLGYNEKDALAKAKAIRGNRTDIEIVFLDSPPALKFDAFDLDWKISKRNKSIYYARPDAAFWDTWRTKKAELKEAGFWVSCKLIGGEKQFFVFSKLPD